MYGIYIMTETTSSGIKLSFQTKGNYKYAKVPGISYRENGKIRKKGTIYLGRVIDEKNFIFFSKDRGVFKFDPVNNLFLDAPENYTGQLKNDQRKKPTLILDFGDSYFLSQLISNIKYDEVIEAIGYKNSDTIYSMIMFYILTNYSCMHCNTWYEGNFAKILYPNADLHSQRISEFLKFLGREDVRQKFFRAHIEWLKKNICNDPAIVIDSTGLPNDIDIELTNVSNHNDKISNEVRMVSAVQRDSGYPLIFRAIPGNINDVSTLSTTITTLGEYSVNTDFTLLDAGYVSDKNIDELYEANIDFVARLPEKLKNLHKSIVESGISDLKTSNNLIEFMGRFVYVKDVECRVGTKQNTAYAFLCYDVAAASDKNDKTIANAKKLSKKKLKEKHSDFHKIFETSGIFIILSSLPFKREEILNVYYNRLIVEQYFDLGKGLSRLIPLRVHSEDRVLGDMMLCQIAATINLYVQKTLEQSYNNSVELYLGLRNQKCTVYSTRIITNEAQSSATILYDKFKIKYPNYFDKQGDKLQAHSSLPKSPSNNEV
jgi:transposase